VIKSKEKVHFSDLGIIDYKKAWDIQEKYLKGIIDIKVFNRKISDSEQKKTPHYLLFCEHPPVVTLGRSGSIDNLLFNESFLAQRGVQFYKNNRGGDITFHGPEQIVGYPILDLDHFFTDIHKYMRLLEEIIIRTIAEYGIKGERLQGATGVWIDVGLKGRERKICAMGVKCSRWVTMHGFALNVNTDLSYFDLINPCGFIDKGVTSMEKELKRKIDLDEVRSILKKHFSELFEAELI
jgi:lipoyl(octanoyl) transferase